MTNSRFVMTNYQFVTKIICYNKLSIGYNNYKKDTDLNKIVLVTTLHTRVSIETGSSTGPFLFISYKHFSHRRILTDHEC